MSLLRSELEVASVAINGRPVGARQPVYIVAEAGVNHDGALSRALQLIDAAAEAGADAVKFQCFRADELVTRDAPLAEYQRNAGEHSQYSMLARLQLSYHDFEHLRTRCEFHNLDFLATPFGLREVELLARLGSAALKIASSDLNNAPLLQAAARQSRPLIISTGAATQDEIAAALEWLAECDACERLILLHCVSAYPTPLESANLGAIRTLQALAGVPCGFSDHTVAIESAGLAVAAGACLLEKHLTLDRAAGGPDHAISLEPGDFAAYVRSARRAERALGDGTLGFQAIERDVRALARKSVVAAQPIPAGSILRAEMLTLKRPGGGITPDQLAELIGRRLKIDVGRDTRITWGMLS